MIKNILNLSALILSVINGSILLRNYLRDKPKLILAPVHPEVYQWWFRLPDGQFNGQKTRKYGFLLYVSISNRGLRKVSLNSWRLIVKSKKSQKAELKSINITEPKLELTEFTKIIPVLGQKGYFNGETLIDSGCSISGMSYFVYECYGEDVWDPEVVEGKINAFFLITDIFGKKAKCEINFSEKSLDYINKMVKGIENIVI